MGKMTKSGIVCLTTVMLCQTLWSKEFKFDFGPKDSPVIKGFTQVTEKDMYSDKNGYGWDIKGKKRLRIYSRNENFSTQRAFLKLGPGLCDHVTAGKNFHYPDTNYTFKVKLDQGEYVGAVVMGKMTETYSATINRPPFWYGSYQVKANGKKIADVDHGDLRSYLAGFCAASENNFFPGDSLFEEFLKSRFPVYYFTVSSPEAIIEMNTICPLNFLLIYPKDKENALKKDVAKLLKEEENFVNAQYKEKKPESNTLSDEDRKKCEARGMLLFTSSEPEITPYTIPETEEIFRPAGEFLPIGEKGVLRFGLRPLKDLKNVEITISDFKDKDGNTLSAKNFSLWLSQCTAFTGHRSNIFYSISPWYAFPYKKQDFKADVSRQFFLYVKLPADTKPGDFSGKVTVKSGVSVAELRLFVKVMPFKLLEADMTLGMYAYSPKNTRLRFANMQKLGKKMYKTQFQIVDELEKKAFREMRAAGFNTVAVGPPPLFKLDKQGKIINETDGLDYWNQTMKTYKGVFGSQPLPAYGIGWSGVTSERYIPGFWSRNVKDFKKHGISKDAKALATRFVKHFYQKAKEYKWPEIIFYIQDELANHGIWGGRLGVERAKFFQKLTKEIGFRTCASMNGPVEIPEIPYLNIAIPNGALPITKKNIGKIRDTGCEYWIYNIGSKRYTMGFYLTKDRPKGRLQWSFYGAHRYLSQIPSLPSLGSIVFSMMWDSNLNPSRRFDVENMRQGIMDYRYFITLDNLVKKYKSSKDPQKIDAVKNANELLKMITGGIDTEIGRRARQGVWNETTCQRLRWRIATAINAFNP